MEIRDIEGILIRCDCYEEDSYGDSVRGQFWIADMDVDPKVRDPYSCPDCGKRFSIDITWPVAGHGTIAGSIATQLIEEQLANGETVSFPSLGIEIRSPTRGRTKRGCRLQTNVRRHGELG